MSSTWKWFGRLCLLAVCASATSASLCAQSCDNNNCNSSHTWFRIPFFGKPACDKNAHNKNVYDNTGHNKPAHVSCASAILAPYSHTEMERMRQFQQRREMALATLPAVERQRILLMWDRERFLADLTPPQRRVVVQRWADEGTLSQGEYQYMDKVWGSDAAPMPGYMPAMGPGGMMGMGGGMMSWFDGLGSQQPADAPSGLPHFGLRPLIDTEPCEPRHPIVQKMLGAPKPLEPVMPLPTYTTRGPRDFLLNDNPSSIGY